MFHKILPSWQLKWSVIITHKSGIYELKWWWWWIVFVVWLTDKWRLALLPAGTIVRDPQHRESPTHWEPEFRSCWMKLCSIDNHYTTAKRRNGAMKLESQQIRKHQEILPVTSGLFSSQKNIFSIIAENY